MILHVKTASKAILEALCTLAASLGTVGSEDIEIEIMPDTVGKATRRASDKPRRSTVRYQAILPVPMDGAALKTHMESTLEALGKATITGIVYQDVVAGTVANEVVTERGIRESRHFNTKSVQRALVHLRQGGLVESIPITPDDEENIDYTTALGVMSAGSNAIS